MKEPGNEGNMIVQTATQELTLNISEETISQALRQSLFKKDATIELTARKENEKLMLESYEIKQEAENEKSGVPASKFPKMIGMILLMVSTGALAAWYAQGYLKKTIYHDDPASSESHHIHPHKSQLTLPEG